MVRHSRLARTGAALRAILVLLLVGACHSATEAATSVQPTVGARLFGLWVNSSAGLPPVVLRIQRVGIAAQGQVALSGVTYTLPGFVDDTSVVLAHPQLSTPAAVFGVLQPDGTLRVTLRGERGDAAPATFVLRRGDMED